jgi:hypothetical protein
LWEQIDLVVDGICEGKGVREAYPTNASSTTFINAFFAVHHLLKRLLEQFLCVVGMEEHVRVEVEILI